MSIRPHLIAALWTLLAAPGSTVAGEPEAAPQPAESGQAEPDPTVAGSSAPEGEAVREGAAETVIIRPRRPVPGPGALVGDETEHRAAERALSEPALVSVIDTDDAAGERRGVAEALASTVGVHATGLGGLGAFSSVSVRGAAPGHTTVIVDGVPLSKLASVTHDLSAFELGSFDQLELYRSGSPVGYGSAVLGGALALSTAVGPHVSGKKLWAGAGAGSYGARHMRLRFVDGREDGTLGYHLGLGYAGAEGDFDYYDDGGTPLNLDDDSTGRRLNNDFDRADYVARLESQTEARELAVGLRGSWKAQGIPGPADDQSRLTSLTSLYQLLSASASTDDLAGGAAGRTTVYASVERQRYRDPLGEIGLLEQDRRYTTLTGGAVAQAARDLPLGQRLVVDADIHGDYYREADLASGARSSSRGRRVGLGVAVADELVLGGSGRVLVAPSLRLDHLRTGSLSDPYLPGMDEAVPARSDTAVTPRLAFLARPADAFAVKANAGRTYRAPTLLELFGDRGFIVGNPEVEPEVGLAADVGIVVAPARALGPADRVYVEAVAFASRLDNPIILSSQTGLVARARNLDGADVGGFEVTGSVRMLKQLTVSGNYSLTETRTESTSGTKRSLPHRPRHQIYGRADLARVWSSRLFNLWFDVHYASGNFLDEANIYELPPRLLTGSGIKAGLSEDLLVSIEVKNLADVRTERLELDPPPRMDLTAIPRPLSDLHGYPLPGRAYYLSVEWSH